MIPILCHIGAKGKNMADIEIPEKTPLTEDIAASLDAVPCSSGADISLFYGGASLTCGDESSTCGDVSFVCADLSLLAADEVYTPANLSCN